VTKYVRTLSSTGMKAIVIYGLLSFLIDFGNLLKTRMLLRWLSKQVRNTLLMSSVVVTVDFVIWYEIAQFFYVLEFWYFFNLNMWSTLRAHYLEGGPMWLVENVILRFPAANFFWAGVMPALWLWLMFLATAVAMIGRKSQWIVNILIPKLDVRNHPVRSIGYVAAASATLVYLLVKIVFF
jgi:hypothetical protein